MVDAALEEVGIVVLLDLAGGGGVVGSGVLAEELDVLLGQAAGLFDGFGALGGSGAQLLGFVLDLFVETLEGGENGVL